MWASGHFQDYGKPSLRITNDSVVNGLPTRVKKLGERSGPICAQQTFGDCIVAFEQARLSVTSASDEEQGDPAGKSLVTPRALVLQFSPTGALT